MKREMIPIKKGSGNGTRPTRVFYDVTIAKHKHHKGFRVVIYVKYELMKRITKTGYVQPWLSDNRIYFMESDSTGYKVGDYSGKSARASIGIVNDDLLTFVGDYDLLWDREEGLYYIENIHEEES